MNTERHDPGANASLDDLFRSARSGPAPEILSRSEARDLLSSAVQRAPLTWQSATRSALSHSARWLQEHMLSTPLRIGATLMTSTALITGIVLAASGIFLSTQHSAQNGHPGVTAYSQNLVAANPAPNPIAFPPRPAVLAVPPVVHPLSVIPEALLLSTSTQIAVADQRNDDSLKPVELSVDQLARLGIDLEKDGNISFYRPTKGGSDKMMRVTLSPDGGTSVSTGVEVPSQALSTSGVPPRIVTDTRGIRRYATISLSNKQGYAFASVTRDSTRNSKSLSVYSSEISQMPGDSTKKMIILNTSSSVTDSTVRKLMGMPALQEKIKAMMHDASHNGIAFAFNSDSTGSHGMPPFAMRRVKRADGTEETIVDTTTSFAKNFADMHEFEFSTDSMVHAFEQDVSGVQSHPRHIEIEKRIVVNVGASEASADHSKIDGSRRASQSVELSNGNGGANLSIRMSGDTMLVDHNVPTLSVLTPSRNGKAGKIEVKTMIDGALNQVTIAPGNLANMIPVRVRNLNNSSRPNEVIFWYDSIPEITNLLPMAPRGGVNSRPSNVTLSVYPNPTAGPSTIHYELKEATKVEFTLHNLLGQKIMDIGSAGAREGDQPMDLSKLEPGIYLLITTTELGDRNVDRIIVTR